MVEKLSITLPAEMAEAMAKTEMADDASRMTTTLACRTSALSGTGGLTTTWEVGSESEHESVGHSTEGGQRG